MKRQYTCTVCFYPELENPPADWTICPCCGVEFEYDDWNPEQRRQAWIDDGMAWWSRSVPPPKDWDAKRQLYGEVSR